MINYIYYACWTLFFILILFEFSPYISTKHIVKKLAILTMAVSALTIADTKIIENNKVLIDKAALLIFIVGAIMYFGTCAIRSYYRAMKNIETRRATD